MIWSLICSPAPSMRTVAVIVIVIAIGRVARGEPEARFKPPSPVAEAQARFDEGAKLFEAKHYAEAAAAFAAAYELDPPSKFLLFNVAVARRMAGTCRESIAAYRAFLEANPPDQQAKNAQIGIERCEKTLAATPTPAPPPIDTSVIPPTRVVDPPVERAVVERRTPLPPPAQ